MEQNHGLPGPLYTCTLSSLADISVKLASFCVFERLVLGCLKLAIYDKFLHVLKVIDESTQIRLQNQFELLSLTWQCIIVFN